MYFDEWAELKIEYEDVSNASSWAVFMVACGEEVSDVTRAQIRTQPQLAEMRRRIRLTDYILSSFEEASDAFGLPAPTYGVDWDLE